MKKGYKIAACLGFTCLLFSNPCGPKVTDGKVSFHFPNPDTLQVVASDKSIVHWEDFSIDKGELTQFVFPSKDASCLNRVISANPSRIFGRLESNGKIYLINPNGILVGDTGTIHTNEFIASTLNIKDEDFLSGDKIVFSGEEKTAIINHGKVEAKNGSIYLISQHIQNVGKLIAKNNTVGLADGVEVILQPEENKKILIKAKEQRFGSIENTGYIEALKTEIKSGGNPYHFAINHKGTILCPKSKLHEKRIDIEALEGKINIAGSIKNNKGLTKINARSIGITRKGSIIDADNGKIYVSPDEFFSNDGTMQTLGGEISIIGKEARFLNSGSIDCSSDKGGKITAIVDRYMNKGEIKADGLAKKGGNIWIHSKRNLAEVSKGLISAQGFPAGNITLISNRICTSGKYNIEGSKGGNLYFETPKLLLAAPKIFAGGKKKGGVVHFGKDDLLTNLFINPFTQMNCLKKQPGKIIVHQEKNLEYKDIESIENFNINKKGLLGEVNSVPLPDQNQIQLIDPSEGTGTGFGTRIKMLTGGNIVVTKPDYGAGGSSYGAFFLFDHITGASIDAVYGSNTNDQVGSGQIFPLPSSGNFVVTSFDWNYEGLAANAGAVTFGYGDTGVLGSTVSSTNSLVGSSVSDLVGNVTVLTNGDYVVSSRLWDNGATDVGAVTFSPGNRISGMVGLVSTGNSLTGTMASDEVGRTISELSNGHFIVKSPFWNTGTTSAVGAVTWVNGTTATSGTVGTVNSVIGSNTNDRVGQIGALPLNQGSYGNFVILSTGWNNGLISAAGAATWVNGSAGGTHNFVVGTSNSLFGTTYGDFVGGGGIALEDGNYVVLSSSWSDTFTDQGAATWGDGVSGTTGAVSIVNSLYGTHASDTVGFPGAVALRDGKYVVLSSSWSSDSTSNIGAATWVDGMTANAVSTTNSIHGGTISDTVGQRVQALQDNDKNFVIRSVFWDNGMINAAGAVTWGNGTTTNGFKVSTTNSIYGTKATDFVGSFLTTLSNGKFIITSLSWANEGIDNVGAVTLIDPSTPAGRQEFPISTSNSLHGSYDNDQVGYGAITEIFNNQYIILSPRWGNYGAITCGDASQNPGITGPITSDNSLIGTVNDDFSDIEASRNVTFNSTIEKYALSFPSADSGNGKVLLFGTLPTPPIPDIPISQLAKDKAISNFDRAISEVGQEWNFWQRPYLKSFNVNIPPFGEQKIWYVDKAITPFEIHENE